MDADLPVSNCTPPPIPVTNQMKPLGVKITRKNSVNLACAQLPHVPEVITSKGLASQGTTKKDVLEGFNTSTPNTKQSIEAIVGLNDGLNSAGRSQISCGPIQVKHDATEKPVKDGLKQNLRSQ